MAIAYLTYIYLEERFRRAFLLAASCGLHLLGEHHSVGLHWL